MRSKTEKGDQQREKGRQQTAKKGSDCASSESPRGPTPEERIALTHTVLHCALSLHLSLCFSATLVSLSLPHNRRRGQRRVRVCLYVSNRIDTEQPKGRDGR